MRINELIERLEGIRLRKGNLPVRLDVWLIDGDACRHARGMSHQAYPACVDKGVEPYCVINCVEGEI